MQDKTVFRYFIINKPYNMVSQFTSPHHVGLLGDLDYQFPDNTHAVGRLDNHSEGLLILTTNKKVTRLLFHDSVPHKRTYLVQVNKIMSDDDIEQLRSGVSIKVKENRYHTTAPCDIMRIKEGIILCKLESRPTGYPPFSWLKMTITEGKFHQVRKMIRATGHRCMRLIRVAIEDLALEDLEPGETREIEEKMFFKKLHIHYDHSQ